MGFTRLRDQLLMVAGRPVEWSTTSRDQVPLDMRDWRAVRWAEAALPSPEARGTRVTVVPSSKTSGRSRELVDGVATLTRTVTPWMAKLSSTVTEVEAVVPGGAGAG